MMRYGCRLASVLVQLASLKYVIGKILDGKLEEAAKSFEKYSLAPIEVLAVC